MKWFGNRNREGHEAEKTDVKPRNQILQVPEKEITQPRGKLDLYQNKSPIEQKKLNADQTKIAKEWERQRLTPMKKPASEGEYKEEKQKQLGKGMELG